MRSQKTVIIIWLCFRIFTSKLVKMATYSSSKICLMEMREPVVMLLKMWADCALVDSLFESFKVARKYGLMTFPLAT